MRSKKKIYIEIISEENKTEQSMHNNNSNNINMKLSTQIYERIKVVIYEGNLLQQTHTQTVEFRNCFQTNFFYSTPLFVFPFFYYCSL